MTKHVERIRLESYDPIQLAHQAIFALRINPEAQAVASGSDYLLIEFVAGVSGADDGSWPLCSGAGVPAGLRRAAIRPHERGIVRCDMKPENLLLAMCRVRIATAMDISPRARNRGNTNALTFTDL